MIRHVKDDDISRLRLLAAAESLHGADVLLDTVRLALDATRHTIRKKPKLSDDITTDLRYQLGRESAFEEILALPEQCMEKLSKEN